MDNNAKQRSAVGIAYQRWALDYVIELVQAISFDYSNDQKKYSSVPADIVSLLSSNVCTDGGEAIGLTLAERRSAYEVVLGLTFYLKSAAFRSTIIVYVEKGSTRGGRAAAAAVEDSLCSFQEDLLSVEHSDIQTVLADTYLQFENAVQVLQSKEISAIFGSHDVLPTDWPYTNSGNREAANLVDAISQALFPPIIGRMSTHKFLLTQRVGHLGLVALANVTQYSVGSSDDLESAIDSSYVWISATRELMPVSTIAAAWRRESLRRSLSGFEQGLLPPHPAGDVNLSSIGLSFKFGFDGFGFGNGLLAKSTSTEHDQQCCSTGDYSCDPTGPNRTYVECKSIVEHCTTDGCGPQGPGGGTPHHHCLL